RCRVNYLPPRHSQCARAEELGDYPRPLVADAVDGGDELSVGHGVRGLFELPEIFGQAGDGCGRVINNLRAVQSQNPRALGEVAVVADINSDARVTGRKDGIARIARREIEFFPEAGMAVGDMVLAVLVEVGQ